jgi:D-alanine-D-alanine ligase and related ATP-grasp enzymes
MRNFIFISPHFPDTYWKFCLALKNKGFNVLGVGDAPYDQIPNECKFALTEYYCCSNMDNYENESRAIKYFKDKYGEIEWLESMNEYWLEKDAQLRTDFDVKFGIRANEIKKYKLKSDEKKYFQAANANVADWILVKDKEDTDKIKAFINKVGLPVFCKPNVGVGSQFTFKIEKIEDIETFFLKKHNCDYICEEFIDGQIVSFDGITNSKADVIFCDEHVFMPSVAFIVEKGLDDMYYCRPNVEKDLEDLGRKVVKSFNVKNRFFHIEFFRTFKDTHFGPKGTLVALEANMRCPGGYSSDLINFANSVSCYNIYADSCAYDENREDLNQEKFYACAPSRRYAFNYFHTEEEILLKYRNFICMYGDYPKVLRDDLGDRYYFAKFSTLSEVNEFDEFVRMKK